MSDYVAQVKAGGEMLARRAKALGLVPLRTFANFMSIRVAGRCSPARLVDSMKTRGYLIKGPFSAPCLEGCIRVTLGPPDLMAAFADALERALAEAPDAGADSDGPR